MMKSLNPLEARGTIGELSIDEDTVWVWRIVAAVSFVDISALNLAASEPLGVFDGSVLSTLFDLTFRLAGSSRQPLAISLPRKERTNCPADIDAKPFSSSASSGHCLP
jgi:hypothetical protein